jgi:hypothetical protein
VLCNVCKVGSTTCAPISSFAQLVASISIWTFWLCTSEGDCSSSKVGTLAFSKCVLRGDSTFVLKMKYPAFGLSRGVKGTPLMVDNSPRGLLLNVYKLGLLETYPKLVEPNFVCFNVEMLATQTYHMHKRLNKVKHIQLNSNIFISKI